MNIKIRILWIVVLVFALAACEGKNTPEKAIEDYLKAWVEGDEGKLRDLVCAEQEGEISRLAVMFDAVEEATLTNVSCRQDSENVVTCDGSITLQYDPNNYSAAQFGVQGNQMPLRSYHVVEEDGRWKMCGEVIE